MNSNAHYEANAINDVARRLVVSETKNPRSSEELAYATERACQKIRSNLSRVLGQDGSNVLVARSLKLAQKQFPCLQPVEATPNVCLEGLLDSIQAQDPEKTLQVCAGIIESLVSLLASLVGENLAITLVEEAYINPGRLATNGATE
jgi:hypothetical protein